jgi:2-hydroxycyclohexanecarboxyl-CoA dehydrogenase
MMRLENRASIVIGGGRGIGKAICLALAREGSDVVIADIEPKKAQEVSDEIRTMGEFFFIHRNGYIERRSC